MFRQWHPEHQEKALAMLRGFEKADWHPFFCSIPSCDGKPHADGSWDWQHARVDQRPPSMGSKDWLTLCFSGGRGAGKSRTGSEITHRVTKHIPRLFLIAATGPDLRDTMVEGVSGILATAPPGQRPLWEPSKKRLTWPNGAIAQGFSAEEPDRLRGPESGFVWCVSVESDIATPGGAVRMGDLAIGDEVSTRRGPRRVTAVHESGTKSLLRIVTDAGQVLDATPEHLLATPAGWRRAGDLLPSDVILAAWGNSSPQVRPPGSSGAAAATTDYAKGTTATPEGGCCTATSGRLSTVPSPTDTRSTTLTATRPTTTRRTSRYSVAPSTPRSPTPNGSPKAVITFSPCRPGESMPAPCGSSALTNTVPAKSVARISPTGPPMPGSAPVAAHSVTVVAVLPLPPGPVRDLTVEGVHEYVAEGCIVHNCDEPAHFPLIDEVWQNMLLGLRLGKQPKVVATTTPKPTKWMKALIQDPLTITRRVSTYANIDNLADSFKRTVLDRFEGTRMGRQELHGEILEDVEGALWTWDMFQWVDEAPPLLRIVVGVDPAGSTEVGSDETGIVVIGVGHDKQLYVLADATGIYTPHGWAKKANDLYERWEADGIVAEKNYGGDMVKHTLQTSGYGGARIVVVNSRRGKAIRAEPIVARYEQKLVSHVGKQGALAELEDECTSWVPGQGRSPNRVDALVHGGTELLRNLAPTAIANPNQLRRHLRAVG